MMIGIALLAHSSLADDEITVLGRPDRNAHFLVCYTGSLMLTGLAAGSGATKTEAFVFSAGTMMGVGLLKELSDTYVSGGDLRSDLLGALLGAGTGLLVFHF